MPDEIPYFTAEALYFMLCGGIRARFCLVLNCFSRRFFARDAGGGALFARWHVVIQRIPFGTPARRHHLDHRHHHQRYADVRGRDEVFARKSPIENYLWVVHVRVCALWAK